jgi:hypothetical protein
MTGETIEVLPSPRSQIFHPPRASRKCPELCVPVKVFWPVGRRAAARVRVAQHSAPVHAHGCDAVNICGTRPNPSACQNSSGKTQIALSHGAGFALLNRMTLDELCGKIKACAEQMNTRYGGVVFDEWVVVSLDHNRARILHYIGPRNDEFLHNFVKDLGALRTSLLGDQYGPGDFEFARHGVGTGIESFLVLGHGLYLVCNDTRKSMDEIAKNPRWLEAQVPFAELAETIRGNPLSVSWDTKVFSKS